MPFPSVRKSGLPVPCALEQEHLDCTSLCCEYCRSHGVLEVCEFCNGTPVDAAEASRQASTARSEAVMFCSALSCQVGSPDSSKDGTTLSRGMSPTPVDGNGHGPGCIACADAGDWFCAVHYCCCNSHRRVVRADNQARETNPGGEKGQGKHKGQGPVARLGTRTVLAEPLHPCRALKPCPFCK